MEYGKFVGAGKGYQVSTPFTPATWSNVLFNDEYYLEVSQTLQGQSSIVEEYQRTAITEDYRFFYLLNHYTKEIFTPNRLLSHEDGEGFSCVHGLYSTQIVSIQGDIKISIEVIVPTKGCREIWTVEVENLSDEMKDISLFSMFGFADHGVMGGSCSYNQETGILSKYAFPYHVFYEEKKQAEHQRACYYLVASETPSSCDMSRRQFFGGDDIRRIPDAVKNERCSNIAGAAEAFCGAFQHRWQLPAKAVKKVYLLLGAGKNQLEAAQAKQDLSDCYVDEQRKKLHDFYEYSKNSFFIKTPDDNLNHFTNYWLKKQMRLLTRQNRGSRYCPTRNQLQDAMGYALLDAEAAWHYFEPLVSLQQNNGFLEQWHFTDETPKRGLCLLNHTDGPLWLVICVGEWLHQMGDIALLSKQVPYLDGPPASLFNHLLKAVDYMYQHRGSHGLCLMGDGDWCDPVNGVGRNGKGESTWSTLALIYAIDIVMEFAVLTSQKDVSEQLQKQRTELVSQIHQHCWDGQWYCAGFDDAGVAFGDKADQNRLFLNAQSWALLTGVADKEKQQVLKTELKRLETPFGPLLIDPPFAEWDERWGRISIKKSGTTENGSVYCHGSMFMASAHAHLKEGKELYQVLAATLPTNPANPPERNLQLPVYIPNYYYGLRKSVHFGRSSQHIGTGTIAWFLMITVQNLLGVQAKVNGIRINPCLPEGWQEVSCVRKFKDAVYHVEIKRLGKSEILIDGQLFTGTVLPYQAGQHYQVTVAI